MRLESRSAFFLSLLRASISRNSMYPIAMGMGRGLALARIATLSSGIEIGGARYCDTR